MNRFVLVIFLAAALCASAEGLSGTLATPALRRTVQLVYIEKVEGKIAVPSEPAQMNQKGNQYLPHLLPIVAGTSVVFTSEDAELHNVFARSGLKVLFNQGQPAKAVFKKEFPQTGMVKLSCNIHKEMTAWVLVLQNQFWATPDPKTGAFQIQGLPAGSYKLRLWGEKLDEDVAGKKFPVTVGAAQPPLQIAER